MPSDVSRPAIRRESRGRRAPRQTPGLGPLEDAGAFPGLVPRRRKVSTFLRDLCRKRRKTMEWEFPGLVLVSCLFSRGIWGKMGGVLSLSDL